MNRRIRRAIQRQDYTAATYHHIDHYRRRYNRMAQDFAHLRVPMCLREPHRPRWTDPDA